jgi:spermidine synthase/MFS family permease/tetratricopeptide (TPR) repeat protein
VARLAPFIAFFFSGVSSLVFQMIWSRLLHHVFGSSSVAISSVVSVFMGGLGLGAWLFGRYADRMKRPLLLYAWAELGVGAFALCVPLLVRQEGWLATVNAASRQHFGSQSLAFVIARFLCIVPVLIIPTTLMGSTLPLLARHFVASDERASAVGPRVGALYAVNTVGAVLGVFLAGFVLMPRIGVAATNAVAVGCNFALGLGILLLRHRLGEHAPSTAPATTKDDASAPSPAVFSRRVRIVAATAFALSGFCSLLYEVVWSRALVNTIGGSVYSFALILMTFLVGIAGGSAAASALGRESRASVGAVSAVAAGLCVLAPLPIGLRVSLWAWALESSVCLCALVGVLLFSRRKRREQELLEVRADGSALELRIEHALLLVPLLVAAGNAACFRGRLEVMVFSALLGIAALLSLLLLLARRLLLLLASVQLLIALTTFVSDLWADQISLTFAGMVAPFYHALGEHVDRVMAMMFMTVALCVLPSALGMGAMFPLTMRVFSAGGGRVGREVSVVYAGNTLGSIAGAWLPGFLLMPSFGMQATLHVGIALNLLLGALVLLPAARDGRLERVLGRLVLPTVAGLIALLYLASARPSVLTWNLSKMTLGVFRISLAKDVLDQETWGEPDLVFYEDGLSTTVSVERWGRHYSLKNNGKVEASNGNDMPTQIMVAALPLLLHPKGARGLDVAIIGLGSGVTVGAALQFPVRSIEVLELERAVARASRYFAGVNHLRYGLPRFPYVSVPRLSLINDDGRNYLASTAKRYDLIVGEPSNPWLTGVADLFTVDHFRLAKQRLRPGGLYCEWVQLYEMSPENVKTIYRTFASQFRHVVVFSAEDLSSDTVLIGSDSPLPLDLEHLGRGFAAPGVAAELERAYVHSPFDVLARVLLSNRDEVLAYTQLEERRQPGQRAFQSLPASTNQGPCALPDCRRTPAPLNTDDNARIEFAAPRDLIGFERYKGYLQTIYAESWPYGRLRGQVSGFSQGADASQSHAELAMALLAHGRKREAGDALQQAAAFGPSQGLALGHAMLAAMSPGAHEPELGLREPPIDPAIGAHADQRIRSGYREVQDWLARGDAARAKAAMQSIPSSLVRYAGPAMRYLRGYVLYRAGDFDMAVGELEAVARTEPGFTLEHPELYFFLGRSHDALLHFDKAVRSIRVYVEAHGLGPPAALGGAPEPAPGDAPVSDEPGESDKRWRTEVDLPQPGARFLPPPHRLAKDL